MQNIPYASGEYTTKGFRIKYTSRGENYRYAIYLWPSGHIVQVATGSGHEDMVSPTIGRMKAALESYLRMAKPNKDTP